MQQLWSGHVVVVVVVVVVGSVNANFVPPLSSRIKISVHDRRRRGVVYNIIHVIITYRINVFVSIKYRQISFYLNTTVNIADLENYLTELSRRILWKVSMTKAMHNLETRNKQMV